ALSPLSLHAALPISLAAEAEALAEAHEHEQRGRQHRPAGRARRRQRADEDGRHAHREQRRDERALAPDTVAEVPEEDRADGACDERDAEHGERLEQGVGRVVAREEHHREDEDGGRRVGVEVVELDRRPDEARHDDARLGVARGNLLVGRRGDGRAHEGAPAKAYWGVTWRPPYGASRIAEPSSQDPNSRWARIVPI